MLNENEEKLVAMFASEIENCLELDSGDEIIGLDMAGVKSVLRSTITMAKKQEDLVHAEEEAGESI